MFLIAHNSHVGKHKIFKDSCIGSVFQAIGSIHLSTNYILRWVVSDNLVRFGFIFIRC